MRNVACLLECLTVVLQPACQMLAGRIAMRPVHHAALVVPGELALVLDRVPHAQRRNPWSNINVVRDQEGLPGGPAQYETLVAIAIGIVRKNPDDCPDARDLARLRLSDRRLDNRVVDARACGCGRVMVISHIGEGDHGCDGGEFFQFLPHPTPATAGVPELRPVD